MGYGKQWTLSLKFSSIQKVETCTNREWVLEIPLKGLRIISIFQLKKASTTMTMPVCAEIYKVPNYISCGYQHKTFNEQNFHGS